ncbi:hypothetical protein [Pseudoxanthomonas sacheonensis]|uniref:hypothetical protein n=1 Tax=Pseudoxanthomonas sacheonensis TaxID=443615 RepID=UPI0013D0FC03|nr:hypothetical protein [Pseudoxanthomonas sacheonensis]KAF1706244.1 hypothetical protein CSC73_16185 [Pseudoxanthomonas sacheonensis]
MNNSTTPAASGPGEDFVAFIGGVAITGEMIRQALAAQPAPGVGGLQEVIDGLRKDANDRFSMPTGGCYNAMHKWADHLAALSTRPAESVGQGAVPNDDDTSAARGMLHKYGAFIYEVDFGDEGKGRYVRLNDFTRTVAKLEAQVAQGGEAVPVAVVGIGGYPNWLISWLESPSYVHLPQGTKLYAMPPNAKHWHDLYRKESQLRRDDAARYGEQILVLETATPLPDDYTTTPTPATGSGGEAVAWVVFDSKQDRYVIFNPELADAIAERGLLTLPVFGDYEWLDANANEWKPINRLPYTWERELGIQWRAHPAPAGGDAGDSA